MKNLIKGLIFASIALSFGACNNDKAASTTAATATTPATTAPADNAAVPAATSMATTPAATTTASTPATVKAQVEPVKPSAAQTTPPPPPPPPAAGSAGKITTIKFDESTYNWGSVNEGDKMTHNFKFKNTGSNDLIISDARGSCGCTVPEWPKEPIKPGKSGDIKVVFDSKGKPGENTKTVTLTANTEQGNTVLTIKGSVKPAPTEEKK